MRVTNRMLERAMTQNISTGLQRVVDGQDSVLEQVQDPPGRAAPLAVASDDGTASAQYLAAAAAELDQILHQVFQSGTTGIENEYISAGSAIAGESFQGSLYMGGRCVRQVEVSGGVVTDTSYPGNGAFENSTVIGGLPTVRNAMQSGNPSPVRAGITEFDTPMRNLQTIRAEVGGRLSQLAVTEICRHDFDLEPSEQRSALVDVDFDRATTEFLTAQPVLEAARASASSVLRIVLTEFLR